MIVRFYAYYKLRTSTSIPTDGTDVECAVVEPCNVDAPVLKTSNIGNYNYCYIDTFKRYYFIESVSKSHNMTIYYLSCDIMASNRTAIRNANCYVVRCADSTKYDNTLNDTMYPTKPQTNIVKTTGSAPFHDDSTYIVQYSGVSGAKTVWVEGFNYHHMVNKLWQTWGDVSTDVQSYVQLMGNATENIRSIRKCYIPWTMFTSLPSVQIYVGNTDTGSTGRDVTGRILNNAVIVNVPKPDNWEERPSKLYNAKYSLWIPGSGFTEIPANLLHNVESIRVNFACAMDTGAYTAEIYAGSNKIKEVQGVFSNEMQVAFQNINLPGAIGGITSTLSSISMGNVIGTASGILSGLNALIPSQSTVGGVSSCNDIESGVVLMCFYQDLAGEDISNNGRPCCKYLKLSTCTGYVKCENAHVVGMLPNHTEYINNTLETGAYIE